MIESRAFFCSWLGGLCNFGLALAFSRCTSLCVLLVGLVRERFGCCKCTLWLYYYKDNTL